jgi:multisubunit Na+/H+ antiporter MnhB subunit
MEFNSVSYFAAFAGTGATAVVAALFAMLRERAQRRRRDLDRVSLVPWGLLSVLFLLLAIILLATAAKIAFTSEA